MSRILVGKEGMGCKRGVGSTGLNVNAHIMRGRERSQRGRRESVRARAIERACGGHWNKRVRERKAAARAVEKKEKRQRESNFGRTAASCCRRCSRHMPACRDSASARAPCRQPDPGRFRCCKRQNANGRRARDEQPQHTPPAGARTACQRFQERMAAGALTWAFEGGGAE